MLALVWKPWKEDIRPPQVQKDWHLLSFAAHWRHEPKSKIIYMDQRHEKNVENDKALLQALWELLDEADIVIGHNVKGYDIKKINARFIEHKMQPPSSFRYIDTLAIVKKHFGFTYKNLDWVAQKLLGKKKRKSKKFEGIELWKECLNGNIKAWEEMRRYNQADTILAEEIADLIIPWDKNINTNVYREDKNMVCTCGKSHFMKNGKSATDTAVFQRYRCVHCGAEWRSRKNLLERTKKSFLMVRTTR